MSVECDKCGENWLDCICQGFKRLEGVNLMYKWNRYKDHIPVENQLLLIFRIKNKKYVVAKFCPNEGSEMACWVTQQSLGYEIEWEDLWIEFPFVKMEKIYK